jgi:galactonate dehydratase
MFMNAVPFTHQERSSRRSFLSKAALGISGSLLATSYDGLANSMEKTSKPSAPSDLKITDVKCGFIRNQHSLFVKIYTNQGIVGHGQAVDGVYGTYFVVKHLAQLHLIGQNPLNVHRLQEEMRRGGLFKGAQAGMYVCVMTALETALWDLLGKALGVPVYQC